jgi:maleate isomerase
MPDMLGYRRNFGIVIPSVNTAAQPEFEAMRPAGVTNQTARIFIPHISLVDDASFIRQIEQQSNWRPAPAGRFVL